MKVSNEQLAEFKEWFIDKYPYCKDYLDLTYFDVEKNIFIGKCLYNPDSVNAAWILRVAFESWQHQQAKVEELQHKIDEYTLVAETLDDLYVKEIKKNAELKKKIDIMQDRVDLALKIINEESEEVDLAEYRFNGVFVDANKLEQTLKGE